METERTKEVKTKTYRWVLKPGRELEVESLQEDRPKWIRVEVPPEHEVVVSEGKIRSVKGRGKRGEGRIKEIKPESFFYYGDTFVGVGRRVRVPFPKKK